VHPLFSCSEVIATMTLSGSVLRVGSNMPPPYRCTQVGFYYTPSLKNTDCVLRCTLSTGVLRFGSTMLALYMCTQVGLYTPPLALISKPLCHSSEMHMWSSCIITPLHSLIGPVGQLFASRLGGQRFTSQGCTHASRTGILLLAFSHFIGDPDVIPDHQPQ
jgi:hypothetical protein